MDAGLTVGVESPGSVSFSVYQIWAPAIILPICNGAMSSERSPGQTINIFLTMLLSTVVTLLYAYLPIAPLQAFVEQFEPAVFGVVISLVIYFIIWLIQKAGGRPQQAPA